MKKVLFSVLLILVSLFCFSQQKIELFNQTEVRSGSPNMCFTKLTNNVSATLPDVFESTVPLPNSSGSVSFIKVVWTKREILTDTFKVMYGDGITENEFAYTPGVYYKGTQANGNIASLSITQSGTYGLITKDTAEFQIENNNDGFYRVYNPNKLAARPQVPCATSDSLSFEPDTSAVVYNFTTRCVRVFYDLNFSLYQANSSSVQNTVDWATNVYNNVSILHSGAGISTLFNETHVWTSADPYTSTSSITNLGTFKTQFATGNPTHDNNDCLTLVGLLPGNQGGVASTVGGLCLGPPAYNYRHCTCDVVIGYNSVPTYSWTVEVVAHEEGHLFGAYHTHACVYAVCVDNNGGNCTAIDNCGPQAGYPTEAGGSTQACGTCTDGPNPGSAGGTIMSYCHIVSGVGINFNNGFGVCPSQFMINYIDGPTGTCLLSCNPPPPTYCTPASILQSTYLSTVKGSVINNSGASSYTDFTSINLSSFQQGVLSTVKYKLTSAASCTTYTKIWIDYNNDQVFDNTTELFGKKKVVIQAGTTGTFLTIKGSIPNTSDLGNLRLRIGTSCGGSFNTILPCTNNLANGEFEDYTVTVAVFGPNPGRIGDPDNLWEEDYSELIIIPDPSSSSISVQSNTKEVEIYNLQGKLMIYSDKNLVNISELNNGIYIVKSGIQRGKFVKQ